MMDNLMYETSAPGSITLFGSESLSVWLPTLVGSIDRRLTVTLKEQQEEKNFELKLPDLSYEFKYDHKRICYQFLEEKLPMSTDDYKLFNWKSPQFINMSEMDSKITNFLLGSDRKRTPQQTLSLKVCIFLYSGIFSSSVTRVNPLSITVMSKIKMGYSMGNFQAYCVAMAAAFIQYLKFKLMLRQSKDSYIKKLFKITKNVNVDLTTFSEEEKEAIHMWACCATYFRPSRTSGSGVYCSTYGCLSIYTSKGETWKNEVEHLPSTYQPGILLVDTGEGCKETAEDIKLMYKEDHQSLYNAWCLLSSRISITTANIMRQIDSILNSKQSQEVITAQTAEKTRIINKLFYLIHVILRSLGLSHPKAEEILEIAYNLDLRGCDVGAACGAMVYVFLPPLGNHEIKLKEAYKKSNFKCVSSILGAPGVCVKINDGKLKHKSKR